jgi:hypothetical protein
MFPKVGLLEETKGGKEGKNDGERIIMKYFTSVIEKDTRKHTESAGQHRMGKWMRKTSGGGLD